MYRVWARDTEDETEAAEYGAIDVRSAAEIHARYGHDQRDMNECTWPLVMIVVDPGGASHAVRVDREYVPEFHASRPVALADLEPALHITENDYGPPLCDDIRLPPSHKDWPHGQRSMAYDKVPEKLDPSPSVCKTCVARYTSRKAFLADVAERRKKIEPERAAVPAHEQCLHTLDATGTRCTKPDGHKSACSSTWTGDADGRTITP